MSERESRTVREIHRERERERKGQRERERERKTIIKHRTGHMDSNKINISHIK